MTGPIKHVSYSSFTDLLKCGKYYQLKRILKFPGRASWWLVGGKAVHVAAEHADRCIYVVEGR